MVNHGLEQFWITATHPVGGGENEWVVEGGGVWEWWEWWEWWSVGVHEW